MGEDSLFSTAKTHNSIEVLFYLFYLLLFYFIFYYLFFDCPYYHKVTLGGINTSKKCKKGGIKVKNALYVSYIVALPSFASWCSHIKHLKCSIFKINKILTICIMESNLCFPPKFGIRCCLSVGLLLFWVLLISRPSSKLNSRQESHHNGVLTIAWGPGNCLIILCLPVAFVHFLTLLSASSSACCLTLFFF